MSPPYRGYQQYCALARALDVSGDRWTLLIVRELAPGPRRFTDLLHGLPGISRNLLTQRVRELERNGIITRQELPPPVARQVYELSDDGRDLATAMVPLIAWGARRLGDRRPEDSFRARWPTVALAGLADTRAAKGVRESYEYLVDDAAFHFTVDDGAIEVHDGRAADPVATVTTDEETWLTIMSGKMTVTEARGALTITGDPEAVERMSTIFAGTPMFAKAKAASAA
jgi:DNA-binding HxlR family transcriptional regulator/putative sterol carrier protein